MEIKIYCLKFDYGTVPHLVTVGVVTNEQEARKWAAKGPRYAYDTFSLCETVNEAAKDWGDSW